jgi:MscS family membrane protein
MLASLIPAWLQDAGKIAEALKKVDAETAKAVAKANEAVAKGPQPAEWLELLLPAWSREKSFLLEHWQWLGLLLLILVAVILDKLVALLARRVVSKIIGLAGKLRPVVNAQQEDELRRTAGRPWGFLVGVGFIWLLLPVLALPVNSAKFVQGMIDIALAIGFVWAMYRLVDVGVLFLSGMAAKTESKIDDMLVPLARRVCKIFVFAIGAVFVAQNQGLEVGSLIAGLGVGGLAFALAAKDTVANLFGSFTVITDQPFEIGDWISVAGVEGTVETVGFRSTRVRTFYDSLVTVPNSKLIDSTVDNFGKRRYRRYSTKFGLAYDTPAWKVEAYCEALREVVRRHPRMRKDGFHIYFNDLGDSALLILVYVFFVVPDWTGELQARHEFLSAAMRVAERLGVEYAFPTRTLHMASTPDGSVDPLPGPDAPAAEVAGAPAGASVEAARATGREIAAGLLPDSE